MRWCNDSPEKIGERSIIHNDELSIKRLIRIQVDYQIMPNQNGALSPMIQ